MADEEVIIIKKKGGGHGGHHGGAWKVAYADFVTAMMALFIVLWLMNCNKPVQEAIGGYFRDPNGTAEKRGTRLGGAGDAGALKKEDMTKLKEDLMEAVSKVKEVEKLKKLIEMKVTPEGLQIEMMEDSKGAFFEQGSAQPTTSLTAVLKALSPVCGRLPNPISIEGHTDSKPYSDSTTYGNWELSTDRANTARRIMQSTGLRPDQIVQVRGYADRKLRNPAHPDDAANRRVTLIIQNLFNPMDSQKPLVSSGTLPPINPKDVAAALPKEAAAPAVKK
jgi:chemotaxis protein MotB